MDAYDVFLAIGLVLAAGAGVALVGLGIIAWKEREDLAEKVGEELKRREKD